MPNDLKTPSIAPRFSVTEFLAVCNETFEYAFSSVEVEGEVLNFKVSKGRWVFFDLKDGESTVPCFMTIYQLRTTIRDGMKVVVSGTPRVTQAGRFSLTANQVQPIGDGSIKKAFELLKAKLESQGVFDPKKKRRIPEPLSSIGVISSVSAAGYADFIKILNERWGGLDVWVANCGVQGLAAADEIIHAIDYFNLKGNVDIIAIVRGGGSSDDLAVFNDELLAKKIASSRIPVITGIGHEVDETIADLAADVRASTPTNAAELLTKDKNAEIWRLYDEFEKINDLIDREISFYQGIPRKDIGLITDFILTKIDDALEVNALQKSTLESYNPEEVLRQGYSILSGEISPGSVVKITTEKQLIKAEIKNVQDRI